MSYDYFVEREIKNLDKLEEISQKLPFFCREYFIGVEQKTSILTKVGYAGDFLLFFKFLTTKIPNFKNIEVAEFTLEDLDKVTLTNLEQFMNYLSYFVDDDKNIHKNNEKSKARKISGIRSMFKYFYNKDKLSQNVASKISMPKLHDKDIIRLEKNEVENFIDTVEGGYGLSKRAKSYHNATQKRDVAIITLLLGTGIRISECVGINIDDVDFEHSAFKITRKGGNQVVLYFSDEVGLALYEYFEERITNEKADKQEKALFLSLQNRRIGVRTVEKLVEKYAKIVTPLKNITPHKLRSTYGTELYRKTHDIYVVAEVLGHKDVNTTKKHYAAISEDIRKEASKAVSLRNND